LIILGRREIKGLENYGQENRISGKLSIPKKPIPISTEYCLVQNLTRDLLGKRSCQEGSVNNTMKNKQKYTLTHERNCP
jgi:hypothetical protein